MTTEHLLLRLQQAGIQLYLEPEGKLRMAAESPPDAAMVAEVACSKTALLDLLCSAPLQELLQLLAPALCRDRANIGFASKCLQGFSRAKQLCYMQHYQSLYQQYADDEPNPVKKDSAGTVAANNWLRQIKDSVRV